MSQSCWHRGERAMVKSEITVARSLAKGAKGWMVLPFLLVTLVSSSFGDGAAAYARYLGTSYADFVIGDFMTEAIYPTLLRQDPRYLRRSQRSGFGRFGYAVGQLF